MDMQGSDRGLLQERRTTGLGRHGHQYDGMELERSDTTAKHTEVSYGANTAGWTVFSCTHHTRPHMELIYDSQWICGLYTLVWTPASDQISQQ